MEKGSKRSIIAGLYGNALEWYDFMLYASFVPVFSKLFFPSDINFISLLATFGVFAMSFFMRPFGGLLIGHYADHAGRRKALILSVSLMSGATLAIAFLPTYAMVGFWAPLLMTSLRLIQGLAVGGELPGTATFLIEHIMPHRRGLGGSLILCTAFLGIFAGSFVAASLSHYLPEESVLSWGWRLAYLVGGGLGLIGIVLRFMSKESPSFLEEKKPPQNPAKLVFQNYKRPLLLAVLYTSIMALCNYILIAYVTTFLVQSEGFLLKDALMINFTALLLLTLLIPVIGYLSDYVGRKPIFICGVIALAVYVFPFYWLFLSKNWSFILLAQLGLALVLAPLNATVPTIIAEMFPTSVRASGTSIGYNIGQAFFGGTIPIVALTLTKLTGNQYAPGWYIFAWAVVVLSVTFFMKETYKEKLVLV